MEFRAEALNKINEDIALSAKPYTLFFLIQTLKRTYPSLSNIRVCLFISHWHTVTPSFLLFPCTLTHPTHRSDAHISLHNHSLSL